MSQSGIRQQVISYLALHGSLEDSAGRATARLRQVLEYEGSEASFTQLIAAMDRVGELNRHVKGKRTYRISAIAAPPLSLDEITGVDEPSDPTELDYDELAATLLAQVVQTVSAGSGEGINAESWARRRIERLERRSSELERELSRVRVEARAIAEERDGLQKQFEHSEANLALLRDRLGPGKPNKGQLASRLQPSDRALLHQLRRSTSTARPEKAS